MVMMEYQLNQFNWRIKHFKKKLLIIQFTENISIWCLTVSVIWIWCMSRLALRLFRRETGKFD